MSEELRAYPPEPTTDGADHAHNPEACAACRRLADIAFASGLSTEQARIAFSMTQPRQEDGLDVARAVVDDILAREARNPLGNVGEQIRAGLAALSAAREYAKGSDERR